jgi:glycerol-3-phosphate dehydrogenase
MARTVEDVLARRMRILFLDARAAMSLAPAAARLIATELNYNLAWEEAQVNSFNQLANQYIANQYTENKKYIC